LTPPGVGGRLLKSSTKETELAKKMKIDKSNALDEKAETLWEIFEKTGSIGAYLLYVEHTEDVTVPPVEEKKVPSR